MARHQCPNKLINTVSSNEVTIISVLVKTCYHYLQLLNTVYGKTFGEKTFMVEKETECSQQNFAVAASFSNECLLLVNYSS